MLSWMGFKYLNRGISKLKWISLIQLLTNILEQFLSKVCHQVHLQICEIENLNLFLWQGIYVYMYMAAALCLWGKCKHISVRINILTFYC